VKRFTALFGLAALAALAAPAPANAAGFAVDTQAARATGLATAVAAHIDDPSAAFYNPAGLIQDPTINLMAGDTLILPSLHFTPSREGTKLKPNFLVSPPPHVYAAVKITDDVAAGFGFFTAYGSTADWPETWPYRFRSLRSQLSTFYLNPEVACSPHKRVRIGAGFQAVRGSVSIERKLNFVDTEGTVELSGGTWGLGWNAGIQVDVLPKWLSAGLAYRSGVALDFEGQAHFKDIPKELSLTLKDQAISAPFKTPDTIFLGVSSRPLQDLLIAADVHWYNWSRVEAVAVTFEDPALNQNVPKRWEDTFNYHIGAEYQATDALSVRAGFVYDPTPSPADTLTPDLPDSTRVKGAVGLGYSFRAFQFDVGYQLVVVVPGESTAPGYEGSYGGSAHVLGLSVGYHR
jgi:long-chain fatty acid transport protein